MSIPLVENAAVLAPHAALTKKQQQFLLAVDPLKTLRVKGGWLVRGQKFSKGLADAMQSKGLIREQAIYGRERLALTLAGKLAAGRLEERARS